MPSASSIEWMVDAGDHAGFALETGEPIGSGRDIGRQHLQGHVAAEPFVACAIHLSHPSRAERGENLVGTEAGTQGEWHRGNLPQGRGQLPSEGWRVPLGRPVPVPTSRVPVEHQSLHEPS